MSRGTSRDPCFLGMIAIATWIAPSLCPSRACAQTEDVEAEVIEAPAESPIANEEPEIEPGRVVVVGNPDVTVLPDPIADRLATLRLAHHDERRHFGIALFAAGLGSAVAGAIVTGAGYEDAFSLGMGVGHLGWGVINAVAALFLMDLGDAGYRRIEADRAREGEDLARARENAIREQHGRATVWAFNAGLDVLYIVSGILLYFIGDELDAPTDRDAMRGYSVAQIGQGGFLLAYDLVGWILAAIDADAAAAIAMPRW